MNYQFLKAKLTYLFTSEYWFDIHPNVTSITAKVFLIFAAILLASAVLLHLLASRTANPIKSKLLKRFVAPNFMIAVSLGLWYALRWQVVSLLGGHFVGIALVGIWIISVIPVTKYFVRSYKLESLNWQKEQDKLKYLNAKR